MDVPAVGREQLPKSPEVCTTIPQVSTPHSTGRQTPDEVTSSSQIQACMICVLLRDPAMGQTDLGNHDPDTPVLVSTDSMMTKAGWLVSTIASKTEVSSHESPTPKRGTAKTGQVHRTPSRDDPCMGRKTSTASYAPWRRQRGLRLLFLAVVVLR